MRWFATLAGLSLALLLRVAEGSARENTSSTEAAPSSFRGVATVTGVADGDTLYADIGGHPSASGWPRSMRPRRRRLLAVAQSSPCAIWSGSAKCCCGGRRSTGIQGARRSASIDGMDVNAEQVKRLRLGLPTLFEWIRLPCLRSRRRRSSQGLGQGRPSPHCALGLASRSARVSLQSW